MARRLLLLAGVGVRDGRLQPRRLRVEVLEFLALLRLELPRAPLRWTVIRGRLRLVGAGALE